MTVTLTISGYWGKLQILMPEETIEQAYTTIDNMIEKGGKLVSKTADKIVFVPHALLSMSVLELEENP